MSLNSAFAVAATVIGIPTAGLGLLLLSLEQFSEWTGLRWVAFLHLSLIVVMWAVILWRTLQSRRASATQH